MNYSSQITPEDQPTKQPNQPMKPNSGAIQLTDSDSVVGRKDDIAVSSSNTTPRKIVVRRPSWHSAVKFAQSKNPSTSFALRQRSRKPFMMVSPTSQLRLTWELGVITPLVIYLVAALPFTLCFQNEARGGMAVFNIIIDLVFLSDMVLIFRTGLVVDAVSREQDYDQWHIAKRYLRGWFFVDLLSSIPFGVLDLEVFDSSSGVQAIKDISFVRIMKMLRFLKLAKIVKGAHISKNLDQDQVDLIQDFLAHKATKDALGLASILLKLLFLVHVMACFWVAVGRNGILAGLDSWFIHDMEGYEAEDTTQGSKVGRIYLSAFYYCLTTMTTVGYGDILPVNDSERGFTICLEVMGGLFYAYIVGSLTALITNGDPNRKREAENLAAVSSYVEKVGLPLPLGRRIRRFYRFYFDKRTAVSESKILEGMTIDLRKELTAFLVQGDLKCADTIVFQLMPSVLWDRVLPLLMPCIFDRDDIVCLQGEYCVTALLITEGALTGSTCLRGADWLKSAGVDADVQARDEGSIVREANEAEEMWLKFEEAQGGDKGGNSKQQQQPEHPRFASFNEDGTTAATVRKDIPLKRRSSSFNGHSTPAEDLYVQNSASPPELPTISPSPDQTRPSNDGLANSCSGETVGGGGGGVGEILRNYGSGASLDSWGTKPVATTSTTSRSGASMDSFATKPLTTTSAVTQSKDGVGTKKTNVNKKSSLRKEHEMLHRIASDRALLKPDETKEDLRVRLSELSQTSIQDLFEQNADSVASKQPTTSLQEGQQTHRDSDGEKFVHDDMLHLRIITNGQVVNMSGLYRLWHRCIESVKALGAVECHALSTRAFADLFRHQDDAPIFEAMQERVAVTQFEMMPDPDGDFGSRTKWGVPLHRLSISKIKICEAKYRKQQQDALAARRKALQDYKLKIASVPMFMFGDNSSRTSPKNLKLRDPGSFEIAPTNSLVPSSEGNFVDLMSGRSFGNRVTFLEESGSAEAD